ncbi:MAG: hypothetical protein IPP72_10275 [Chitinophagaceae bacterium]|nr:hypothetical protein [Chitinophagaceae bacterium]
MKLIKNTLMVGAVALALSACKKTVTTEPLNGAGQTLVKFVFTDAGANPNGIPDTANGKYAGYSLFNVDLSPTPQTLEVADLRRDVPNSTELNKPMTIVIQNDPGAVTAYDPELISLPDGSYTADPSNPISGTGYTVTLAPGELAKTFKITIPDVTSLDLNNRYGLGFTISTVDADGHISALQKTLVIEIGTKNPWDGAYRLYASFFRSDLPTYVGVNESPAGYYEFYNLITSGPNTVDATINTTTYGVTNTQIIYVIGSGYTYFTGVAPRINVDKNSHAVTVTQGTAAVGTSVAFLQNATELAASKYYPNGIASAANSAGKPTIVAHFRWSSGGIDRNAKDTFVYRQPR